MKNKFFYSIFLLCLSSIFTLQYVHAYDYDAHDRLTIEAVKKSKLNQYIYTIGLTSMENKLTDLISPPCIDGFDCSNTKTIIDWFSKGARNEDATVLRGTNADDLNNVDFNLARYQHHFYDPIYDIGYYFDTVFDKRLTGLKSPDWGLEDKQGDIPNQNYSLKDARDYLYRGLTLTEEQDRESNLALLFRSLGHALHLIEDMAQPQHTRNDSHGGHIIFGEASLYEAYTEKEDILKAINFSGYAPVVLPNARDYWYTSDGKGLADYSNRGFVSAGTNFLDEENDKQIYLKPDLANATESYVSIRGIYEALNKPIPKGVLPDGTKQELQGTIDLIGTKVKDYYRSSETTNDKTSSFSIFNADLDNYNKCFEYYENDPDNDFVKKIHKSCKLYTLNYLNFDAAHKLLIPRAVGYGAGLINHFFRGKLEITMPEDGFYPVDKIDERGFNEVSLKLKNITPKIGTVDQNMSNGQVVL